MKSASKNRDNALLVAGIIFLVAAALHLLRLIGQFNLLVARHLIPMWVSYVGFFVFFGLAIWMFVAWAGKGKRTV